DSVSASGSTRLDLPTPPLAFMTVMELRMRNREPPSRLEHPHRKDRQWVNQDNLCPRPGKSDPREKCISNFGPANQLRLRPQTAPTCTRKSAAAVEFCGSRGCGSGQPPGGCRM